MLLGLEMQFRDRVIAQYDPLPGCISNTREAKQKSILKRKLFIKILPINQEILFNISVLIYVDVNKYQNCLKMETKDTK